MKELVPRKVIAFSLVLIFALHTLASAQKLVVGYSGVTAIQAPFWIIKDAGYFKQEGLDANLIYISASSTMAQAMMAGEVAISTANSQAVVDTRPSGGRPRGGGGHRQFCRPLHYSRAGDQERCRFKGQARRSKSLWRNY